MSVPSGQVHIKRIYDPAEEADGTRVLVDRVWPRGITRERAALDLWLKDIAPSTRLRKWFSHDPARWTEFRAKYRAELDDNHDNVAQLRALAKRGRTTLLYGAHDTEHNQAVVLREFLVGR